jgi:hypothetical protein
LNLNSDFDHIQMNTKWFDRQYPKFMLRFFKQFFNWQFKETDPFLELGQRLLNKSIKILILE